MVTITTLILSIIGVRYFLNPLTDVLDALDNGVDAFKDNDFSLTIRDTGYKEVHNIITLYNDLAAILRSERMDIFQRELLLDTVIQSTPVALILTTRNNHIVYSNAAAREQLKVKGKLEGADFCELLNNLSPELIKATTEKHNGLVTEVKNDQSIIYNVNCQNFVLNGRVHYLYLYKNLTTEMSRRENDMWKQVIRLISHELNNSLAPIASLTRSAKKIIEQPEHIDMLGEVLDTISNRTQHLNQFISEYAKFAKLPKPVIEKIEISSFFSEIQRLTDINCELNALSQYAYFDSAQIEQVLINLIKNAKESGSAIEDVGFNLTQEANLLWFSVFDRGDGLSEAQLQQALLPFYTTKASGSGVGLALCNEIVMAHGGNLRLSNRDNGGVCVSFSIELSHEIHSEPNHS